MRGFIAIELDNPTRRLLCDIQQEFREEGVRGNYSRPENLHLTIKFLGELDESMVRKVSDLVNKTAPLHDSFVLTLDSIGNFNKGNRPILWAGLKKNDALLSLYNSVEDALEVIMPGKREKSYSPHMTLVREAIVPQGFFENLRNKKKIEHSFKAEGLSLMESTRVDGRLTYIRRAFEPFK